MELLDLMFQFPVDLELWIVLVYVAAVVIGARVIEALARLHLARAHRNAEKGFEYLAEDDHYRCAGDERLSLYGLEPERGLAVYHALPEQCHGCRFENACAPHSNGRRIYRSLATWAETDVGRFHQRIALLMFAAGSLLSAVGVWRWSGRPGTGYLLVGLIASTGCMTWDWKSLVGRRQSGDEVTAANEGGDAVLSSDADFNRLL